MPVMECSLDGKPGWKYGPSGHCYTYPEGDDKSSNEAKQKAYLQGAAITGGKMQDASGELSREYLQAVYDIVMSHPALWDQIKAEIHVRARGSAGGQLKGTKSGNDFTAVDLPIEKLSNASPTGGKIVYEDGEIIEVPVVVMKEGEFTGSGGETHQKIYEEFSKSAKWLQGIPILPHHIPGMITSNDRRLGRLTAVRARPDRKDIYALAQFDKELLTEDELAKIKNEEKFDGSIGYTCNLEETDGKIIEKSPYSFVEYAIVPRGACSAEHGCGFFQNESPKYMEIQPDYQKLIDKAFGLIIGRLDELIAIK
jgi:hypothetical protein